MSVSLEAGDVALFHGNVLHRSGPNDSDIPRSASLARIPSGSVCDYDGDSTLT